MKLARELERMGAHFLAVKDMAGLLKPFAARKLVKALKEAVGLPIHLHTHDTSGSAARRCSRRRRRGWTWWTPRSRRSPASPPSRTSTRSWRCWQGTEWDPQPRRRRACSSSPPTGRRCASGTRPSSPGLKSGTAEVYRHEIPGGQYSNYKPQVAGLGLLDKWEECKDMYRKVNLLFGDLIKVTPSSKVVGDMAMFLVKNGLEPEDLFTEKGKDLAFPESVVGLAKGMLGQPHGGFPEELRKMILQGPGADHLPPRRAPRAGRLRARSGARAAEKVGRPVDDKALVSCILYPNV